jgi:hypothetical protein
MEAIRKTGTEFKLDERADRRGGRRRILKREGERWNILITQRTQRGKG